mgnify:CR=1 FL=1
MAEENEKRSPVFDWDAGDFVMDPQGNVKTVTGSEAVVQIVLKAQQTVRSMYLIYADIDNPDRSHTYGNDAFHVLRAGDLSEEARISELERAVNESLIYDPWITAVEDIDIKRRKDLTGDEPYVPAEGDHVNADEVYASFTVLHIFGESRVEGVTLNG